MIHSLLQKTLILAARIAVGAVFLMSAAGYLAFDFGRISTLMEMKYHVPMPKVMLAGGIVFLLAGSLSIIIGFYARIGALLLFVFLAVSSYYIHPFWNERDVLARENELLHLLKNLALMGAMVLIMAHGSGPMSVDDWRRD